MFHRLVPELTGGRPNLKWQEALYIFSYPTSVNIHVFCRNTGVLIVAGSCLEVLKYIDVPIIFGKMYPLQNKMKTSFKN